MWQKFTERLRVAVYQAGELAKQRGEQDVQPEHFLLAVLEQPDCMGARLLAALGVSKDNIALPPAGEPLPTPTMHGPGTIEYEHYMRMREPGDPRHPSYLKMREVMSEKQIQDLLLRDPEYGLSERAKAAIENTSVQSVKLGNDYIGTEHMVLGIIAEGKREPYAAINAFSLDLAEVRDIAKRLQQS